MDDVLTALLRGHSVETPSWHRLWDRLAAGRLRRGEAAALLASLTTRMPASETVTAMLDSLEQRRATPPRFPDAVNIVGTGGGPRTFNISTAAAFVAAASGVRVIKSGSRGYRSPVGSIDLLDRLGVTVTGSYEETAAALDGCNLACTGSFVYPEELALLVRSAAPLDPRVLGGFLNAVGPFLAGTPVAAQLTGVSDRALLPVLRALGARDPDRRVWLCTNDAGADELLSIASSDVDPIGGEPFQVVPDDLGIGGGALADLAPEPPAGAVTHFLAVVAGAAHPTAVRTVCLNAAALRLLSGADGSWHAALDAVTEAIGSGAALALVERVRGQGARPALNVPVAAR